MATGGGKKSKNSRGGDVNKKSKKGPRKEELEIGRGGRGAGGRGRDTARRGDLNYLASLCKD